MGEKRGSIAFFSTYRPPVPLDIYSSPICSCPNNNNEIHMTDGKSFNYNGREIPRSVLITMLTCTQLGCHACREQVDSGHVSGLVFVSERTNNLETLHVALRFHSGCGSSWVKVFSMASLYCRTFRGVRMEDSGGFAGDRYLIFVSTMQSNRPRQPWTAVYRTDLTDGKTIRLTPQGVADFSPSVSPSGEKIAIATLEHKKGGWTGEVEDLMTDIVVMNVREPFNRKLIIKNGGWPSWGNNNILYYHRVSTCPQGKPSNNWGVFRADIATNSSIRITPDNIVAMTPAGIDENRVVVAVIRNKLDVSSPRRGPSNYRHIEVFDLRCSSHSSSITQTINPLVDHYNPFVIWEKCQMFIGYSRCNLRSQNGGVVHHFEKVQVENPQEVGLFRVPGLFPTFTKDGKKLAFVDNKYEKVYVADTQGLRVILNVSSLKLSLPEEEKSIFSPVWNQNPQKDILYICVGATFKANRPVHIYAIYHASSRINTPQWQRITDRDCSNNAFPSTNPEGTKLVFRSTRDWLQGNYQHRSLRPKNLYTIDVGKGPCEKPNTNTIRRLTNGNWIDTHCQWSPNGQWIVFSSTREKPSSAPPLAQGMDPGYYGVYLMRCNDSKVVVRVVSSGGLGAGHVTHPMFSPDGNSIVFSADLAAVSVEPISLPFLAHSFRPYGDIFSVDIKKNDIFANQDLVKFDRVTHSRYENSMPNWSMFTTLNLSGEWIKLFNDQVHGVTCHCPYAAAEAHTFNLQSYYAKRCC